MSTLEEISLQTEDSKEVEVENGKRHTKRPEPLKQDVTTDFRQGASSSNKGAVTKRGWKIIFTTVTTLLTAVFLNAGISMIAPFYPIVAHQHNVASYITGFVLGTASLCVAVMSPLIGYILPFLGVKFTQLAGLWWAGGSLILFGFVSMMPTPALFTVFSFLLRIVEGTGTAMYTTVSYAMLTRFYPEKKGTIVGLMQLSISVGYAIGPAIGGGLQEVGGFKLPFLVVGGGIVILMLLLMVLAPPAEYVSEKVLPWRLFLKLFSNVMFVLIVVSFTMYNVSGCGVLAYYGQFLYTQFHFSAGIIGVIYFTMPVIYSLGTVLIGMLTDKLRIPRYLIIAGLVVGSAGCVFVGPPKFITSPKIWLSISAWILTGVGWALTVVPTYQDMNEAAKMLKEDEALVASTLSGILVGSISTGTCLGPIIGGALVYKVGFQWMAAILGLGPFMCALVLIIGTAIQKVWKNLTGPTNIIQCCHQRYARM